MLLFCLHSPSAHDGVVLIAAVLFLAHSRLLLTAVPKPKAAEAGAGNAACLFAVVLDCKAFLAFSHDARLLATRMQKPLELDTPRMEPALPV